jgi:thiol:disulfide interchange protein DsbD
MPLSAFLLSGVLAVPLPADEPLEPERAFPLTARRVAAGVELRFNVREGYYLYANRFGVKAPGLPDVGLRIPEGTEKDDAFVGKSRILRGDTVLLLPFSTRLSPGVYEIHVTAQGCAEQRVCYAPFTQSARVRIP